MCYNKTLSYYPIALFTEHSYAFPAVSFLIEMPRKKEKEIHVLLVCEDPNLIGTEKACLEKQGGLHIETASSKDEAAAKLEKTEPDVIVADFFPTHSDSEILATLRSKGAVAPVIVFAYNDEKELFSELCKSGKTGFVGKSGDPDRVYSSLKSCIVTITAHHSH